MRGRGTVEPADGIRQRCLARGAAESLLGDFLHAVLSEKPFDHAATHGLTWIDQQLHLRPRPFAEQCPDRAGTEIPRNDSGDLNLAGAHGLLGLLPVEHLHENQRFLRKLRGDGARHCTLVLVDDGHRNLPRLRAVIAPEHIAEKGGDENRHQHADDHGAPIGHVDAQVIPDQCSNGDVVHACPAAGPSRKACPVRAMKTSSKFICPLCTDVTRRPRPAMCSNALARGTPKSSVSIRTAPAVRCTADIPGSAARPESRLSSADAPSISNKTARDAGSRRYRPRTVSLAI